MRVEVIVYPHEPNPNGYWANLREALSQLLLALIGGNANLTTSAQLGYWQVTGQWRGVLFAPLVDLFFGDGHCEKAWEAKV